MSKIKIFSLGGLNENGKNMYVINVDKDIFVFDAGLKYDNDSNLGIDYIIPNYDYLIKNEEISTQEELTEKLIKLGFKVTQATVSRDIKELKLIKVHSDIKGNKYSHVSNEISLNSCSFFTIVNISSHFSITLSIKFLHIYIVIGYFPIILHIIYYTILYSKSTFKGCLKD